MRLTKPATEGCCARRQRWRRANRLDTTQKRGRRVGDVHSCVQRARERCRRSESSHPATRRPNRRREHVAPIPRALFAREVGHFSNSLQHLGHPVVVSMQHFKGLCWRESICAASRRLLRFGKQKRNAAVVVSRRDILFIMGFHQAKTLGRSQPLRHVHLSQQIIRSAYHTAKGDSAVGRRDRYAT